MGKEPLVSAIMVFLNSMAFMEEAVESVMAQTYRNWELVLVDDGSTDGSSDLAQKLAARNPENIFYYEHPKHRIVALVSLGIWDVSMPGANA